VLAAFWSSGYLSVTYGQDADSTAQQLKALEQSLEKSQEERERVASQAVAVERDLATVRRDMIATAKDIQDQEHSLTVLEGRIDALQQEADELSATLGRRDEQMVSVLLALQRLAVRPQDALTLQPLNPDDAVRTAILLRAAVPHIKESANELQGELANLYRVRAQIIEQKERAASHAAALLEKRKRLQSLEGEKETQQAALVTRQSELDRRVGQMAREAEDLRELFEKLAEEKKRREAEERARREREQKLAAERAAEEKRARETAAKSGERIVLKPPPGMRKTEPGGTESTVAALPPDPRAQAEAEARQARLREEIASRSFAKARGTMPYPISGNLTVMYGESGATTPGGAQQSRGIAIAGRPGAQVVAPFDGIVAFAGPFRGYGRLLIIEHSEGYHTLLAGLGRISSAVGQVVLAGEPVGIMEENAADTSLYVELRRDGQPINPLPWLASRTEKSSG